MHQMSIQIQAEAAQNGFAYFALGALYDRSDIKGPFSLTKLMTSFIPFGPYFSADGVHPNGTGQAILARAAAQALNNKYGLGIPLL
jgi:lysophospholipase L1-like esterase